GDPEPGDALDRRLDLIGGDQTRALELARGVLVARAPEEILVVEAHPDTVPAGIAGVIIDHAIRRTSSTPYTGVKPEIRTTGTPRAQASQHERTLNCPRRPGTSPEPMVRLIAPPKGGLPAGQVSGTHFEQLPPFR